MMSKTVPPEKVARVIHDMILKEPAHTKGRWLRFKTILLLKKLLPSWLVEKLVGMLYA